jgi:bacillithiol system protein YtxJ
MMTQRLLRDLPAFEAAIAEFPRILLFKHSPLCPISVAARDEYDTFCDEHEDAPTMFIDVIASRAAARGIAESCGVQQRPALGHPRPAARSSRRGSVATGRAR